MLDVANDDAAKVKSSVRFTARTSDTLLTVKSWLPERLHGQAQLSFGGCELPSEVGATRPGPIRVLSLAPGEWLLVSEQPRMVSFQRYVAPELSALGLTAIDVSAGFAIVRVSGSAARDMLSKGCALDLERQAFAAGQCARTRFAQIQLIIECIEDAGTFDLYVGRSYLRYLIDWLDDATIEFKESEP
jgi:sarcosine oxidase, subunit gamma